MITKLNYQTIFNAAAQPYAILSPGFKILGVNQAYLIASNREIEKLIGKNVFDAFPDNPDDPEASGIANLTASLEKVLASKKPHTMAIQQYDVQRPDGNYEVRFWRAENIPILDENDTVTCILHTVEDVTHSQVQKKEIKDAIKHQEKLLDANRRITDMLEQNLEFERKTSERQQ